MDTQTYQPKSFKAEWVQNPKGLDRESICWAKGFGTFLATDKKQRDNPQKIEKRKLSTNQLRRFFGLIKRLQVEGYSEENRSTLLMLAPQLAYAVGRDKKRNRNATKIDDFYYEISQALEAVEANTIEEEKKYFQNFVNLVEAIVAYHRAAGGE